MSAPHLLRAELETVPARVLADSLQAVGSKQKPAARLELATGVDENRNCGATPGRLPKARHSSASASVRSFSFDCGR